MENIIINIDSRFRDKHAFSNASNFTYTLSEKIKNCKYIRLSSIEIPNLYFTFSTKKNNNSFKISILDASNNLIINTITINDGFYDSGTLLSTIQTLLDNIFNIGVINILFHPTSGFVSFYSNVNFSLDFSNGLSTYDSLGYQLGFRNKVYNYINGTHSGQILTYTSESQLDVTGDHYIFFKINDYGVIYNDFEYITYDLSNNIVKSKYAGDKNIFAKIIMTAAKTDQLFDNCASFLTKSFIFRQPVDIDKFNIKLIDPKGNIIDMLQMDFSFTLEVGVVFDSGLGYELTNVLTDNFMVSGLPSLPNIEKVDKRDYNLNIINDNANTNNDLDKFKIADYKQVSNIYDKNLFKKKRNKKYNFTY